MRKRLTTLLFGAGEAPQPQIEDIQAFKDVWLKNFNLKGNANEEVRRSLAFWLSNPASAYAVAQSFPGIDLKRCPELDANVQSAWVLDQIRLLPDGTEIVIAPEPDRSLTMLNKHTDEIETLTSKLVTEGHLAFYEPTEISFCLGRDGFQISFDDTGTPIFEDDSRLLTLTSHLVDEGMLHKTSRPDYYVLSASVTEEFIAELQA